MSPGEQYLTLPEESLRAALNNLERLFHCSMRLAPSGWWHLTDHWTPWLWAHSRILPCEQGLWCVCCALSDSMSGWFTALHVCFPPSEHFPRSSSLKSLTTELPPWVRVPHYHLGCYAHCLLCVHAKSFQLCLTLCDPMMCSLPDSSIHGDSLGKNTGVDAVLGGR